MFNPVSISRVEIAIITDTDWKKSNLEVVAMLVTVERVC